jgi:hypothetical protein
MRETTLMDWGNYLHERKLSFKPPSSHRIKLPTKLEIPSARSARTTPPATLLIALNSFLSALRGLRSNKSMVHNNVEAIDVILQVQ